MPDGKIFLGVGDAAVELDSGSSWPPTLAAFFHQGMLAALRQELEPKDTA